ncbi:alpha/beta hydrolase [soil metagenome]
MSADTNPSPQNDPTHSPKLRVLQLPGWQGSGPDHWQTLWERKYGDERVDQHDYVWPRRGDWMSRLDECVQQSGQPVALVAHSLGCQLVASWAAHTQQGHRVACAMLVAPPDTERADMPPNLAGWRHIERRAFLFPSMVVASTNDPYCSPERSGEMASNWGSEYVVVGAIGHINSQSAIGDWPAGRDSFNSFATRVAVTLLPNSSHTGSV